MPSQVEIAKADEPRQSRTDQERSPVSEDRLEFGAALAEPGLADPVIIMRLQATAGNAAVAEFLARQRRRVPVQRDPDAGTAAALQGRVRSQLAAASPKPDDAEAASGAGPVDAAALAAKKKELRGSIPVPPDASSQNTAVEQAAAAAKQEAHKAPEPAIRGADRAPPKSETEEPGPMAAAAAAGKLAQDAFASAAAQEVPPATDAIVPLQPVPLTDAGSQPLPPDPGADLVAAGIAMKIQRLRQAGHRLRLSAAGQITAAHQIKGFIHATEARIAQGESALSTLQTHTTYRREVTGQAKSALEVSQQKAATVAEQAPGIAAKGGKGQQKSGPMAGEASRLAGENASKQPDDADAAAKSREQGAKLNRVGSDLGTMNDAIMQTTGRAHGLVQEAADAKAKNAETQGKIAQTEASLAQTEARFTEMTGQNAAARDHLAGLTAGPAEMIAAARALDQQGEGYVQASIQLEAALHQSRTALGQGIQAVPAAQHPNLEEAAPVQRDGYEDRVNLNLNAATGEALPAWVTGETPASAQARLAAKQATDQRHRSELDEINKQAGGNFQQLSAADKAGIALRLTGRHLRQAVGATSFPNFVGGIARAFVDPRVSLMGVVAGLSMTLSGVANLLSAEQWAKDPVGNLLKSAADIATGITIVLGSIAGLAVAIIVVLTALSILSFGLLGPVAAAVIPFCATVAATVGPWAITAAEIALLLQGLVLIKNLIDAATARTATELETKSDQMTEDAKAAGQMALQVGMAKAMSAIGERVKGGAPSETAVPAETAPVGAEGTSAPVEAPPAAVEGPQPVAVEAPHPPTAVEAPPAAPAEPMAPVEAAGPKEAPVSVEEPGAPREGPSRGEAPASPEEGPTRAGEEPSGHTEAETKPAEPAKPGEPEPPSKEPPVEANGRKARVLRLDEDFAALKNDKGYLKSHLEPDGSLAPASPAGDCTPLEHIYGSQPAKGNSPYSSFLSEGEGGVAKSYGQMEIELDMPKLQADIKAGKLPGVEVLSPNDLQGMITDEIQTTAKQAGVKVEIEAALENGPEGIREYLGGIEGLSGNAAAKLGRRLLALFNTTRDGEYLVKGVVPAPYLTGPRPAVPVP